jgi:hypothetical protein
MFTMFNLFGVKNNTWHFCLHLTFPFFILKYINNFKIGHFLWLGFGQFCIYFFCRMNGKKLIQVVFNDDQNNFFSVKNKIHFNQL